MWEDLGSGMSLTLHLHTNPGLRSLNNQCSVVWTIVSVIFLGFCFHKKHRKCIYVYGDSFCAAYMVKIHVDG